MRRFLDNMAVKPLRTVGRSGKSHQLGQEIQELKDALVQLQDSLDEANLALADRHNESLELIERLAVEKQALVQLTEALSAEKQARAQEEHEVQEARQLVDEYRDAALHRDLEFLELKEALGIERERRCELKEALAMEQECSAQFATSGQELHEIVVRQRATLATKDKELDMLRHAKDVADNALLEQSDGHARLQETFAEQKNELAELQLVMTEQRCALSVNEEQRRSLQQLVSDLQHHSGQNAPASSMEEAVNVHSSILSNCSQRHCGCQTEHNIQDAVVSEVGPVYRTHALAKKRARKGTLQPTSSPSAERTQEESDHVYHDVSGSSHAPVMVPSACQKLIGLRLDDLEEQCHISWKPGLNLDDLESGAKCGKFHSLSHHLQASSPSAAVAKGGAPRPMESDPLFATHKNIAAWQQGHVEPLGAESSAMVAGAMDEAHNAMDQDPWSTSGEYKTVNQSIGGWQQLQESCLHAESSVCAAAATDEAPSPMDLDPLFLTVEHQVEQVLLPAAASDNIALHEILAKPLDEESCRGASSVTGSVRDLTFAELQEISSDFSKRLGAGSFGQVFAGRAASSSFSRADFEPNVAVKVPNPGATKPERHFWREVRMAEFESPYLVPLLAVCMEVHALVYPRAERTLEDHLRSNARPSPSEGLIALLGTARGLHALHNRGFVHRDVKSANIFLFCEGVNGQSPTARLGDYGLVWEAQRESTLAFPTLVGTASYLDPEAVISGCCSWTSDVFSFGVVMLEVLLRRSVTELHPDTRPLWRQLNQTLPLASKGAASAIAAAVAFVCGAGGSEGWNEAALEAATMLAMDATQESVTQPRVVDRPNVAAVVERLESAEVLQQALQPSPSANGVVPQTGRVCTICFEQSIDARFNPCFHALTCQSCAPLFVNSECPLCRSAITGFEVGKFESTFSPA